MYRSFKFYIVLLFLALFLLFSCAKKTEVASYKFEPGESFDYKFWMTQQVETEEGLGKAQRLKISFNLNFTVDKVDAKKTADIIASIKNVNALVSSDSGRETLQQFAGLATVSYLIRQQKDGAILEIKQLGEAPDGLAPYAMSLKKTFMEMLPSLPTRLSIGTAWAKKNVDAKNPMITAGDSITRTNFELGKLTNINGYKAHEINVNYKITFADPDHQKLGDKPVQNKMKQDISDQKSVESSTGTKTTGRGSGKLYFDNQAGRFIGARYETVIETTNIINRDGLSVVNVARVRSHIEVQPAKRLINKISENKND